MMVSHASLRTQLARRPVQIAVAGVFLGVFVWVLAFNAGYATGKDMALRDNRADAASQSS